MLTGVRWTQWTLVDWSSTDSNTWAAPGPGSQPSPHIPPVPGVHSVSSARPARLSAPARSWARYCPMSRAGSQGPLNYSLARENKSRVFCEM